MDSGTAHLLRPHQIVEANEEISRLDAMLNAPPYIAAKISDRGGMRRRRDTLKRETEAQSPHAYGAGERDAAVKEFAELAEQIQVGMPSSIEMRRNPPGAVGKQLAWAKRTKTEVARYKHIAMRLLAGGDVPDSLRHEGDIANIERLRPLEKSHQLSMDGAQIPKTRDIHIGTDPVNAVSFNDRELKVLNDLNPALAAQIAVLPGETRAAIKSLVTETIAAIKGRDAAVANAGPPRLRRRNGDEKFVRARAAARRNGINSYGMGKVTLYAVLEEKQIAF